jgi:ribosomal protein L32
MPKKPSKSMSAKRLKKKRAIARAIKKATKSGAYEESEHLTSKLNVWR